MFLPFVGALRLSQFPLELLPAELKISHLARKGPPPPYQKLSIYREMDTPGAQRKFVRTCVRFFSGPASGNLMMVIRKSLFPPSPAPIYDRVWRKRTSVGGGTNDLGIETYITLIPLLCLINRIRICAICFEDYMRYLIIV